MNDDIEFVDGLYFKLPNPAAPDFVKGSISIKRADLGNWLRSKTDEWINIDVKESQAGKVYCAVSTWKPDSSQRQDLKDSAQPAPPNAFEDSDEPF